MNGEILKVGDQTYTDEDLLILAKKAGIDCEEVTFEQERLITGEDPTAPEGEQELWLNPFQTDDTIFIFMGAVTDGGRRGVCYVPVKNAPLEDMGVPAALRFIAEIAGSKLAALYAMVDGDGQSPETIGSNAEPNEENV